MFHLCAFSQSIAAAGLQEIDGVNDPIMAVHGKNIQVPDFAPYLLGAYNFGTNYDGVQLRSPSLRRLAYYEVLPTRLSDLYESGDYIVLNQESPISLDVGEQLSAYVERTNAIPAQNTVMVFLSDGEIKPVVADYVSVRATANVVTSAYQWHNAQLNFETTLPVGSYGVLGAGFWGQGLVAYRFIFQDQQSRPGGLGMQGYTDPKFHYFSGGRLGVWGKFHSSTPPTVDFLSSTVEDVLRGYVDLVRIS